MGGAPGDRGRSVPRVGSRCPGRASASARVLGSILSMRAILSPTQEETPAGAGWMALDYGRNLGAEGGSWPGVGRVDAEMISGRVGSTKGRTRIFAGLANSQPSGHATVGQGAERRRMARSMAPPTSGNRRVAGLTRSGSLGRGHSRRKPGMRGRSYPFRRPTVPPWRLAPPLMGMGCAPGVRGPFSFLPRPHGSTIWRRSADEPARCLPCNRPARAEWRHRPEDPVVTDPAPVQAPPPVILLQHVCRQYADVVALDDVSLTVAPGTLLGIIGPSGAGKTTAVRVLAQDAGSPGCRLQ